MFCCLNKCSHDKQIWPSSPWIPMMLLINTIWPFFLLFMSGRISFSSRTNPKKLVSMTVFISSMDWHSIGPIRPIPALLTVTENQCEYCIIVMFKKYIWCSCRISIFCDQKVRLGRPLCAAAGCPHRLWWSPRHTRPTVWWPGSGPESGLLPPPGPHLYPGSSWWHRLQTNSHFKPWFAQNFEESLQGCIRHFFNIGGPVHLLSEDLTYS